MNLLHRFGPNTLMAKTDLKSAFQLCPAALGHSVTEPIFVDKCLPFGLRSSLYLFNLVADAL